MSEPEVRYLGDVQRLSLKTGDRVVLSVDHPISDEIAFRLREQIEKAIPGYEVIILSDGMKIGVLAKD